MPTSSSVLWGLALSCFGAVVVAAAKQGTRAAAIAGLVPATAASVGFGAPALAPLALFVLGAGALTRVGRTTKEALGAAEDSGGRRGVANVIAKLGLPTLLGLAAVADPGSAPRFATAFTAGIAAAFADTSGTEIGPLTRGPAFRPGLAGIRRVPHGTSGAISLAGLAATIVAAAAIAGVSAATGFVSIRAGALAAFCGVAASLAESVLATTGLGQRLGHHGRNAMLSAVAIALSLVATRHGV